MIASRSTRLKTKHGAKEIKQRYYNCEGVNVVLMDGADHIEYGFNYKRILSWILFEFRLLYWCYFQTKEKPDAIIVSSLSILTFLSGVILKRKYNCKLIVEVRDIWPLTVIESKGWSKNNPFIWFLSYVERKGYRSADAIIGTMPNLKEHVINVCPGSEHKVHYQPMGYDPDFNYGSAAQTDSFADFFNTTAKEKFVVGYAGSIGFANCVDQIVDAANALKDEPVIFTILGDGPLKPKILKQVEDYGLTNIHFFDKVAKNQVGVFLSHPDLLINPWKGGNTLYKYGVSPNKWIDYMHSAKPILVSLDGYHTIINDANCGKFIEADNPEKMAEEILKFSKMDKTELREMGYNGKKYLIEKLSYDVLAASYLKIIDDLFVDHPVV